MNTTEVAEAEAPWAVLFEMTEDQIAKYSRELDRTVAEYELVTRVTILFSVLIQAFLA